ncbi:hypothetical protein DRO69_00745 [Candidatus Bathyarchaeota archaeon]|nr:MAG: hypothetical protein DRO69_00745 [Candidatus Bathyarchaeota archaeon]
MIELWQVALGFAIFSFSTWFEIERTYGPKARERRKKLLSRTRNLIIDICSKEESISKESLRKIASLYQESEQSITSLEDTLQLAFGSGILFLIAVISRVAVDYLHFPELASLEAYTFIFGLVLFLMMIYNLKSLRKLVQSDEDPQSIPFSVGIIVGLILGINAYLIWILIPFLVAGKIALDLIMFICFLFLSFVGAVMFLWKYRIESKWQWTGYFLMILPWIYLMVVGLIDLLI